MIKFDYKSMLLPSTYVKRLLTILLITCAFTVSAQQFQVSFNSKAFTKPFTGDVIIYLSKTEKEPRLREQWSLLPAVARASVKNLKPGEKYIFKDVNTIAYPVKLSEMERGDYYAQVVFDRTETPTDRSMGTSSGNLVSKAIEVNFTSDKQKLFMINADSLLPRPAFENTTHYRQVKVRSKLLSDFYGEETIIYGVVAMPDTALNNPSLKLPLIVDIQGFGGDVLHFSGKDWPIRDYPYISLLLDGNCRNGHHAFANSENNGPWGDALMKELIPEVERVYKNCSGQRFITGHSSGGWSALWLQLQYPEAFDACWSSSPDYVSFKHFQGVDIYKAANFFKDSLDHLTPYALIGGWSPILFNRSESKYEEVVRGEQLVSFEAVFSPRKSNGEITPLWNRQTGQIDQQVAQYWQRYDVLLFLQENYDRLKDVLANKIWITCGTEDNFMLDRAVSDLRKVAKKNSWQMNVKLVPGDHFTLDIAALQQEWTKAMNEKIASRKK